ncbi:hypothetical protein CcaverHIS002_0101120 [Cutaneotrichosporon cavernicola]|uniref:DNA polymerase delta subunit 4 n=1 Tax=Cutaneotrichosporon cavernicola TaxID=279322 RepID=A0AA48I728_9TREE|nr:uncharacterized protein CcaverHIS019_0101100 [Cutaneotrichosporon cavernicola]BEI79583.1 hypothetical protein CcaverHIS002_0101120 [Cutaneotrichosporon cavernicola]BEI87392.1 hypothetical protein CcaverHIS019_0101100 [Cutaneotrichosporon cavernicola]BEI95161.1 hypothetical protein CcaverHIS631_0101100 [Cutaneotrichosporon cavernicola]BEJ02935.1 hypothetical protein CcaverHIS641_0101100 [Cutaneotrichosporon cavernicola]
MAPKRNTKQSAGLTQPTLSFHTQLRSSKSAKAAAKGKGLRKTETQSLSADDVKDELPKSKKKVTPPEPKKEQRPVLDPNGKEWNALWKEAMVEMGGMPPIHGEKDNKVQNILRVFDMTSKYGPHVGITRLERWERAKKWGLQPPEGIKQILLTQQGEDDAVYRESVIYGWL